jgi:hypothetical protein
MGHVVGRELEGAGFATDDAKRVDGADDDDEVRHDVGGVLAQRTVGEGAELHVQRLVHPGALQLLRRRPNARGRNLYLRQKLFGVLERFPPAACGTGPFPRRAARCVARTCPK